MRRKDPPPQGGRDADDLDRELAIDLELEAEEQRERGLSDRDADRAARRALGNPTLIKEEVHDMSPWARFEALGQDLRYGIRMLRRAPAFAGISILTLGLGIGACTAIFSIVYAVLLRPLPYKDPSRLVLLWTELRVRNVPDFPFPVPDVKDLRNETKTLESVAGLFPPGRTTIGGESGQPTEQVRTLGATPNLLSVLGVQTQVGRDFTEADGAALPPPPPQPQAAPGAAPAAPATPPPPPPPATALLTHEFWQRRYGGDPSILGRIIPFGNGRAHIVGVTAPGFQLLMPPRTGIDPQVDIITALRLNFDTAARNTGALRVIARLKDGVSLEAARTDAEAIATTMRERHPVKKSADVHWRVVPMHEDLVNEVRPSILALFGAVVFVLLIACANVANLLAVRAAARHRELVIRAAIGGTRARLIRQLLTETLLLATVGAALGLGLAVAGMRVMLRMAPAKLPLIGSIGINGTVLTFTILTAVITALVCGVLPALRASRPQVVDALRTTQGSTGLRAGRMVRNAVVVVEVALSFVLLIGSGLMLRSFVAITNVDPGYDPNHVLTFQVQPRGITSQEQFFAFLRTTTERVRAVPGVVSVSAATPLPLDGATQNIPWAHEAAGAADPSAFRQANFHNVRPGYFETLKTRLIDGRTYTEDDARPNAPPRLIIDDKLAALAFPGRSAVGQRLLVRNLGAQAPNAPQNVSVEIIGVVRHQRHESMAIEGREALFFVAGGPVGGGANRWIVRTQGPPETLGPSIRAAIAEADARATVLDMQPMTEFVNKSMAPIRFSVVLISIFAAVAVVLAVVGLYGVLSTVVRQRTAEIGVRMAFGATRANILRLVVGEGLRLSAVGVAAGLIAAFLVTGVMRSMLVSVTPTDPVTFVSITALFLTISAIAAWVPARRAARLAPTIALRDE
jgi:putative ABC transport system permease protein